MTETDTRTPEQIAESISAMGDRVIEKLKTVYDPEIPVNIFDLGLIYKVDVEPRADESGDKFDIKIDMTLTTPNCPVAGNMPMMVRNAVERAEGAGDIHVALVWEPPWDKERMTDEARMALNMF
ncbi:MAG: DUF59 domain-containing protein [Alphaproteobacteria bacterium]|nr:DUF59 domain-containing protein [Alphaproteobacteria bacterium]